jgi:hypothetical protein
MNRWDIDQSVDRFRNHPVLGKATKFLADFRDEVDSHSDGWCHWPLPCRAAKNLQSLIQSGDATEAAFKKAIVPIKSFYTRRGDKAGMKFPKIAPTVKSAGNGFAPEPPELDAQGVTAAEFLEQFFEFEYCAECGKDADEHVAVGGPFGNWFAYCKAGDR